MTAETHTVAYVLVISTDEFNDRLHSVFYDRVVECVEECDSVPPGGQVYLSSPIDIPEGESYSTYSGDDPIIPRDVHEPITTLRVVSER